MVRLPSPTSLLPDQVILAPTPLCGPSNVILAFGSILAHGDHASHWCRSLTCGKIDSGDALMVAVRVTLNSLGRDAMKTTATAMMRRRVVRSAFIKIL